MRLPNGRTTEFRVEGRDAFVILPRQAAPSRARPWVWYAPTLGSAVPNEEHHTWMVEQWLAEGIAFAGVDVGESYGSVAGRDAYTAFHERVVADLDLSKKACLLPQSRGGLMLLNWAAEHPECVECIAGIYPVCDLRSYPGLDMACDAYGLTGSQLAAELKDHNPVDRTAPPAKANVPVLLIHGDSDETVPLEQNSGEYARQYRRRGGRLDLVIVPGGGHTHAREFFRSQKLVDFVIECAGGG